MENRKALLPLCSGILGLLSLILQVTAVATPYWAYFMSDDPFGNNNLPSGNYLEEGHYGLWSTCFTIYKGVKLRGKRCDIIDSGFTNGVSRNSGILKYFAAGLAVANVLLLLIFLFPVPAQLAYVFKEKGIVSVRYRTLTFIKLLTLVVGACCGVGAVVLVGIHRVPYYRIPKGWSFGLQVVVVILQVFLFICVLTEHVVGRKYPSIPLSKIKHRSGSQRGLRNPAFSMTSPENILREKGTEKNQFSNIAVTKESGKPISNGQNKPKSNDLPNGNKYLAVINDDINEPGSRKSMQYLEEVDLHDDRPKEKPSSRKKPYYKNPAFRKSQESDLDMSNPSISSRNGRHNNTTTSLSSDTVYSFSKSTDV